MSEVPKIRIPDNQKVRHAPPGSVHIDTELHDAYPDIPPTVDVVLERGKALVTHLDELELTRYVFGEGNNIETEIIVADEIRKKVKSPVLQRSGFWRRKINVGGWSRIRTLLEDSIKKVETDPFGASSLDPTKDKEVSQKLRTVNRVGKEIEQILGLPVAIKGTGVGLEPGGRIGVSRHGYAEREDLRRQFGQMRFLQRRFDETFTPEELQILRTCPVYAYIRYPVEGKEEFQEWILMERIEDATQLEEHNIMWTSGYRAGRRALVFDVKKHPRLARFAHDGDLNGLYWTIAGKIKREEQDLSGHIGDIRGRNILVSGPKGKEVYTIIDPQ